MFIGYMRVSKSDGSQLLDLQQDALIKAGVQHDKIYQDLASGRLDDRPGLKLCLKALQPGNTLVVWKLDRLGRNLKDLINIVDNLSKQDVFFKVLSGYGTNIDTNTSYGKLIFGIFAALAEFERELIVERTKAGLESARARGKLGGRPRKMDLTALKIAISAMKDPKSVAKDIAKKLHISTTTLYSYVNSDGSLKNLGSKLLNKLSEKT